MSEKLWENDAVQFKRLLAEIRSVVDFSKEQMEALCESMDLTSADIEEVLDRADLAWHRHLDNLPETKKYGLYVVWGENPEERQIQSPSYYELNSEEEQLAFLLAVGEADGHLRSLVFKTKEDLSQYFGLNGEECGHNCPCGRSVCNGLPLEEL